MAPFKINVDSSKQFVFDIETIPLEKSQYDPLLEELVEKKLNKALKADPDLDKTSECKKIRAIDPLLGRIVCIGIYLPQTDEKITLIDSSEKLILQKFWRRLSTFNGLFVGFNTVRFDVPFILRRSLIHEVKPTNGLFLQYTRFDPNPPHFDVMLQMSGRDGFLSLKYACAALGIKSSKDGKVSAENVAQAYEDGRINEIAEYCLEDVRATYQIYEKLTDYIAR
jgi:predicted PolB exonuclease-like 3'-5' exonuclease